MKPLTLATVTSDITLLRKSAKASPRRRARAPGGIWTLTVAQFVVLLEILKLLLV